MVDFEVAPVREAAAQVKVMKPGLARKSLFVFLLFSIFAGVLSFDVNTAELLAQISAPEIASSTVFSMDMSNDTIVIGLPNHPSCIGAAVGDTAPSSTNVNCPNAGAVYVFRMNATTGVWALEQYLKMGGSGRSPYSNMYYGFSVSITLDGRMLAVGVPGDKCCALNCASVSCDYSGSVVFYERQSDAFGTWTVRQNGYLKAPVVDNEDQFGHAVEVRGSLLSASLLVGAPYEDSSTAEDMYDEGMTDSGAVFNYYYDFQTKSFKLHASGLGFIKALTPGASYRFGSKIAWATTYSRFAILEARLMEAGRVYTALAQSQLYMHGPWSVPASLGGDDFGAGFGFDSNTLVVGSPTRGTNHGAASFFYQYSSPTFGFVNEIVGAAIGVNSGAKLGTSVAVHAIGATATVVIGAPGSSSCGSGFNNDSVSAGSCFNRGFVYVKHGSDDPVALRGPADVALAMGFGAAVATTTTKIAVVAKNVATLYIYGPPFVPPTTAAPTTTAPTTTAGATSEATTSGALATSSSTGMVTGTDTGTDTEDNMASSTSNAVTITISGGTGSHRQSTDTSSMAAAVTSVSLESRMTQAWTPAITGGGGDLSLILIIVCVLLCLLITIVVCAFLFTKRRARRRRGVPAASSGASMGPLVAGKTSRSVSRAASRSGGLSRAGSAARMHRTRSRVGVPGNYDNLPANAGGIYGGIYSQGGLRMGAPTASSGASTTYNDLAMNGGGGGSSTASSSVVYDGLQMRYGGVPREGAASAGPTAYRPLEFNATDGAHQHYGGVRQRVASKESEYHRPSAVHDSQYESGQFGRDTVAGSQYTPGPTAAQSPSPYTPGPTQANVNDAYAIGPLSRNTTSSTASSNPSLYITFQK